MMHLATPPLPMENSTLNFQPSSPTDSIDKHHQSSNAAKASHSLDCSSIKTQSSFNQDFPEVNLLVIPKDIEISLGEPTKKLKVDEARAYKATERIDLSSLLSLAESSQNKIDFSAKKVLSDDQKSDKDMRESSSTVSTSWVPRLAHDKEIINLEEEEVEDDLLESSIPSIDLSGEPLFVVDDVTIDFQQAKEQMFKQVMARNLIGQAEPAPYRPQVNSLVSVLAMQAAQFNQRNQLAQDLYGNLMSNYGFNSTNPVISGLINNVKLAYLARQAQMQSQVASVASLLGKRESPFGSFENLRDDLIRSRLMELANGRQSNVIVLDEEEKEDPYANWAYNPNKKVFKIEKTPKKKYLRKPIFKIIKTKHRPLISKANIARKVYPVVSKAPVKPTKLTEQVEEMKETSVVSLSDTMSQDNDSRKSGFGSSKKEAKGSPTTRSPKRKNSKKFEEEVEEKDYVINIHLKGDETSEEIGFTPVGDKYQIKVESFNKNNGKNAGKKRIVKVRWNPESATEQELNEYYKEIEIRFEKPIVNQAVALKVFRECGMDVEKVVTTMENSKVYQRDMFEIRQKVLRNRMLYHEISS